MTFKDTIRTYLSRGWALVPYPLGEKRPHITQWQKKVFTEEDFKDPCNVGIKLKGSLVDVDLDCPEAIVLSDEFLPITGMKHGRLSAPLAHRWYNVLTNNNKYLRYQTSDKVLLELRTSEDGSLQTMCPPSIHPSGEPLTWEGESPSTVEYRTLRIACGRLAAATLLVKVFPSNRRNDLALALSGALLRNGWVPEEAHHFLLQVFTHGGSGKPDVRANTVYTTKAKLEIDEPVTGIPRLVEILGKSIVDLLVDWLELDREDSTQAITNETELAEHVVRNNSDIFYFDTHEQWYVWNEKYWACQKTEHEIKRRIESSIETIKKESLKIMGALPPEIRDAKSLVEGIDPGLFNLAKRTKATLAYVNKSSNAKTYNAVASICEWKMSRSVVLDEQPMLLNLPNGELDLRDGSLLPHTKEHYFTKLSKGSLDEKAECPEWGTFLEKFQPDPEVRLYLRRLFGYALTGETNEQVFNMFWGDGGNGKSTVVETIAYIMGDFACEAGRRAFIQSDSDTQSEIAKLEGKRFVYASEPEEDRNLDESIVKSMTGDEFLTVRPLYKNPYTIRPTWKAVMLCNNYPKIRGRDKGIWRRLRIIPFDVEINEKELDTNFKYKLRAEASGILNWALIGCLEWQRLGGLKAPESILSSTKEQYNELDPLTEFMEECLEVHEGFEDIWDKSSDVYEAYVTWAKARSIKNPLNKIVFGNLLRKKGFPKKNKSQGTKVFKAWFGLRRNKAIRQMSVYSPFSATFEDDEK